MTEEKYSKLELKLQEKLSQLGEGEQKALLKQLGTQDTSVVPKYEHKFSNRHTKIGIISDTHIGSKYFNQELLEKAFQYFKHQKVDAIYHAGDVLEGMSGRPGHIYELSDLGISAQVDRAVSCFDYVDTPIYAITGNHDFWAMQKGDMGVSVGDMLEDRLTNFKHLGVNEADVILHPKIKMKLVHPGKGTAYAISYQGQKLIESFEEHEKPQISVSGHYHKAMYMNLRNVHHFEAGTLQEQSGWMRSKNIPAHVGFWLLDIYHNKKGIDRLRSEFVSRD